jgi:predicted enzyme related to lactoylglutathione lyase
MDPVVHFEMPYDDRDRVARFYQSAFGWQTEEFSPEMGHYLTAATAESGPEGPLKPGSINGGFYPRKPDWPAQHPSVVIAVADIRAAMQRVAAAGGEVLGEPMAIPAVGDYVSFIDSEGNRVSLLQPLPRTGQTPG